MQLNIRSTKVKGRTLITARHPELQRGKNCILISTRFVYVTNSPSNVPKHLVCILDEVYHELRPRSNLSFRSGLTTYVESDNSCPPDCSLICEGVERADGGALEEFKVALISSPSPSEAYVLQDIRCCLLVTSLAKEDVAVELLNADVLPNIGESWLIGEGGRLTLFPGLAARDWNISILVTVVHHLVVMNAYRRSVFHLHRNVLCKFTPSNTLHAPRPLISANLVNRSPVQHLRGPEKCSRRQSRTTFGSQSRSRIGLETAHIDQSTFLSLLEIGARRRTYTRKPTVRPSLCLPHPGEVLCCRYFSDGCVDMEDSTNLPLCRRYRLRCFHFDGDLLGGLDTLAVAEKSVSAKKGSRRRVAVFRSFCGGVSRRTPREKVQ